MAFMVRGTAGPGTGSGFRSFNVKPSRVELLHLHPDPVPVRDATVHPDVGGPRDAGGLLRALGSIDLNNARSFLLKSDLVALAPS